MFIYFFIPGIVIITIAFLIPGKGESLWANLNAGSLAAFLLLAGIIIYFSKKYFRGRLRIAIVAFFAIISYLVFQTHTSLEIQDEWLNTKVRSEITYMERASSKVLIYSFMFDVLRKYNKNSLSDKRTLHEVFMKNLRDSTLSLPKTLSESSGNISFHLVSADDSSIIILAQSNSIKGLDTTFQNYNGKRGMIQSVGTLTEKGVSYVTQN